MSIATKNGVPIIKDGSIVIGCDCCGCTLPALPDSIEIDISRGDSQYAAVVLGESPAGGPDVFKYATGAAWTLPDGLFVLQRSSGYYYSNWSLGVKDILAQFTRPSPQSATVSLLFSLLPVRQKTTLDSNVPPTLEQLIADNWDGTGCFGNSPYYFTPANTAYMIRTCSQGSGSSVQMLAPSTVADICAAPATARYASADLSVLGESHRLCLSAGCTFPAEITVYARLWIPHEAGVMFTSSVFATTDLAYHRNFPWYLYAFSTAGIMPTSFYAPVVIGKCTATINSVNMVYGSERVPMFAASGSNKCSDINNPSLAPFSEPCP
jgi:hypothetical protein